MIRTSVVTSPLCGKNSSDRLPRRPIVPRRPTEQLGSERRCARLGIKNSSGLGLVVWEL